jgi:hypothetical protein
MPGARRTRSLVCKGRKHTSSHHRYSQIHPASPHAMVLTVSFVLSPVIGLSCHRHLAELPPRDLTPASRPHDFAVRKPVLSSAAPPASTASHPAFVTIMIRPLWGGTAMDIEVIWVRRKQKYF